MKKIINSIAGHLAACMDPVIPLLMASGMVKLVVLLLEAVGMDAASGGTISFLTAISNAPFYFLPILLAYSSAVHFSVNPVMLIGMVCVMFLPEMTELLDQGVSFAGIPVINGQYSYSVLPVIFLAYVVEKTEGFLNKWLKAGWTDMIKPVMVFTVGSVAGLMVAGPAGSFIANAVKDGMLFLLEKNAILAWGVLAAAMPYLVMGGVHWVVETIAIINLGELGMEYGIMTSFMFLAMSVGGMCMAAFLKAKNAEEKKRALSAGITILFAGISEPGLYGVALKDKKALGAMTLGCTLAGIYQGLVSICCYVYAFPTVFSFLMFANKGDKGNLWEALIGAAIAFGVSFAGTYAAKSLSKMNRSDAD